MTRKRVVAIGAHPDDVEQGMGATLARHNRIGDETYLIICTLGIGGSSGNPSLRKTEAHRAAKILKANLITLDYPVLELNKPSAEFRQVVKAVLGDLMPDRIYVHSPHDYHQTHRCVSECVASASTSNKQLFYYEVISSTNPEFRPNAYVDITDFIDIKIESLHQHQTQSNRYYLQDDVTKSIARYRYVMSKIGNRTDGMAEAFSVARFVI